MVLPTVAFLLVSLLIGVYAGRRIQGRIRNFAVAGNIIPLWVLVFSMTGQAIELGGTQDNVRLAMTVGFWDGAILPLGIGLALILIGLFFAKPLHRLKLLTLPDYFTVRYDPQVGILVAALCTVSSVICIAGNLSGIGIILRGALGIPPQLTVIIVAFVVMVYTIAGGLFAVTWNDILQIGIAGIGFAVAIAWGVMHHDSAQIQEAVSTGFSWLPLTDPHHGALRSWASLLALALGNIVALDFMERVFAARTYKAAQLACIVSGGVTCSIGAGLAFLGIIASLHRGELAPDAGFLEYAMSAFPASVQMLFLMALLGAGISTIDGLIMACAVACSRNILQVVVPDLVPKERLLFVCRATIVPITLASIFLAVVAPVPSDLLVLAFDVVFSGCFVPLALGIYWRGGTARAAWWAIFVPSIIRVLLHFSYEYLALDKNWDGIQTLIPPVVSFTVFVAISLASREKVAPAPTEGALPT